MTFEEYVQGRTSSLLRLAGVLTGDPHLSEDLVQDVLIRVGTGWERLSALEALDAYVRRMVVNDYLSWRRKWSRQIPRAEITPDRVVGDHADSIADRDDLAARLATLPPQQRAAVVLRYYEDLSDDQIAAVLGCRAGTVRSHVSRALRTLRVDGHASEPDPLQKDGRYADDR